MPIRDYAPGSYDLVFAWICISVQAPMHNHTNTLLRRAGAAGNTQAHYSPGEKGCGDRVGLLLDLRSALQGIPASSG